MWYRSRNPLSSKFLSVKNHCLASIALKILDHIIEKCKEKSIYRLMTSVKNCNCKQRWTPIWSVNLLIKNLYWNFQTCNRKITSNCWQRYTVTIILRRSHASSLSWCYYLFSILFCGWLFRWPGYVFNLRFIYSFGGIFIVILPVTVTFSKRSNSSFSFVLVSLMVTEISVKVSIFKIYLDSTLLI